ncbi:MAG TPA: porin family protein [Chitinophagaceae bacterium]|nr:porin family protein [Chitinophagaceae bacterium]
MKKFTLSIATLLMVGLFMIPAQKADAQVANYGYRPPITFGVKVGPNFSSITSKVNGSKNTTDMLVGFQGGVYANIPIAPQFYIQPSLMYQGKGGKYKEGDVKERLNYITLPVDFLFKPEMPNGSGSWIVGVGPYFGYGISGSNDAFKNDDALKRFDVGANVQLGYEMARGLNFVLNADLGLINIAKNGDSDNSIKNTSFGVTVGYTL